MKKLKKGKTKIYILGIFILLNLLIVLPIFVSTSQQKQNTQGRAAPLPTTCSTNAPVDVEIIIDRSGSMNDRTETSNSSPTKIQGARTAGAKFVDFMSQNVQSRLGLSTFADTATLDISLTNNYTSVKTKINSITASGGTCIECSIKKANADIVSAGRAGTKKAVVLLTDGIANYIDGNSREQTPAVAEQKALAAVLAGNTASKTVFFTIGLGKDVNAAFLQQIATKTGGKYYFPPTTASLDAIYTEISQIIAKGSVSGLVFNDLNKNGIMEATEPKLPGWTVSITSIANPQANATAVSDTTGNFSIAGLCDGSYTLKQTTQSGWVQTLPANTDPYTIAIASGNSVTNKDFGVVKASRCSDNIDNDNNGFIDSKDSTCHTDGNPNNPASYDPAKDGERGSNTCSDSKDNNGNGTIDGADPICHTGGNPNNPWDPTLPEVSPRCSDNIDNDNNGFIDSKDSTCHTDGNADNPASYDPKKDGERGGATCADSKDNNENGLIDGADPICHIDGNPDNPTSYDPQKPENYPSVDVTVFLDGMGNRGDNTNPTQSSLSNKNPKHPIVPADVQIFNSSNVLVGSGAAQITYDKTTGNYKGSIPFITKVKEGVYTVKIRVSKYLRKQVPEIQTLKIKQNNTINPVSLVAGDINNNNILNIEDYNLLIECYSDLNKPTNCSSEVKRNLTDINDDGLVNQVDYNLFVREISTQPGN